MQASRFRASVRVQEDKAILDLAGQLDGAAETELDAAWSQADRAGAVLLNFAAVDYINSTGIALIVSLLAKARSRGRAVLSCGLMDHYREIFEITRLADFMTIFPDEQSALASPAAAG